MRKNILEMYEPSSAGYPSVCVAAQQAVKDYMTRNNCSMDAVADAISLNVHSLYKQMNPDEHNRPLHVDTAISLTRLTGDMRIIEEMTRESKSGPSTGDARIEKIMFGVMGLESSNGKLAEEVIAALADNVMDDTERGKVRKKIYDLLLRARELSELLG